MSKEKKQVTAATNTTPLFGKDNYMWMLIGVAVFLVADKVVETRFGQAGVGGAMGIVVGSVVDGVPESSDTTQ